MKRLTKEEFISKVEKIHPEKYDYSEVNYVNNSTKIKVYDKEIKEYFFITPASLLRGCGNKNAKGKKLSSIFRMGTTKFVEKAREVHGDKYDYSKVEYVNNRTKVCIICPEHGEFWQTPDKHLQNRGCPKCCKKNKKYTTEEFIEKAREIHGDKYDYSKTIYGNNKKEKIEIICPLHGSFFIAPDSHLMGSGCKYCNKGEVFNTEEFIEKAKKIHGKKYNYEKTIYKQSLKKVTIICPEHGEFKQTPAKHLYGHGCPKCAKLYRKKETELYNILKKVFPNEKIIHSYYNKEILNKQEIDIFFPEHNIGVEFQGEQHFVPIDFGGYGEKLANKLFEDNQKRDYKKKEICDRNNIKLFYYSNVKKEKFLGEKLYHDYADLIVVIDQVIKKEDEK